MRLENKTAIVTGAASGIGKQIALVFAREGAKVAIADLDQRTADAAAAEIDASGKRAIGLAMDVTNEQQVDAGTAKSWSLSSRSGNRCWRSISTARF
jgi:3-hydroxybutyrate dehydrogenase